MNQTTEVEQLIRQISEAVKVSTDPVAAAGLSQISSLAIENCEQAVHLARCVAAFTTDDGLFAELTEIVGESSPFMISKVAAIRNEFASFGGDYGVLEQQIWTRLFAGRRERLRVMQTLRRRSAL